MAIRLARRTEAQKDESIVMTWDLAVLRDAVRHKHGIEQEEKLIPPLNSVVQRGAFAKFHYLEAKRLLEAATAAHTDMGEMIMLILGSDTASVAFQQARFHAAAHITACVQNMHSTADTLAHAVYFALGMDLNPGLRLEPRKINIWNVMDKTPVGPIRNLLIELVDHDGFRYLNKLSNHSKHRSVVDIPFSVDVTAIDAPSGLKFAEFVYEDVKIPGCWAMPTLNAEYGRQSSLIIGIGHALNSTLIA
jgi:hypothetical protein